MAFRFVPTNYNGSKNANTTQQTWRPPSTDLLSGELAVNLADGSLFLQPSSGNAIQFASLDSNGYLPLIQLAPSGVSAGTYSKLTVDVAGRVTAGSNIVTNDVVSALGYLPVKTVNNTPPDNYGNINLSASNSGNVSGRVAGITNATQIDSGSFISAKYFFQIISVSDGSEITEMSLVQDGGSNVTMSSYGTVYVGASAPLVSITATCQSGTVSLIAIPLKSSITISFTRMYFSS